MSTHNSWQRRSAVVGEQPQLKQRAISSICSLEAYPGKAAAVAQQLVAAIKLRLPERVGSVASGAGVDAVAIAPNKWLLLAEHKPDLESELGAALAPSDAAVVDQSHGYVCLQLQSEQALTILAQASLVDWRQVEVGAALNCELHHCRVLAHRRGVNAFDLLVSRSAAQYLHDAIAAH